MPLSCNSALGTSSKPGPASEQLEKQAPAFPGDSTLWHGSRLQQDDHCTDSGEAAGFQSLLVPFPAAFLGQLELRAVHLTLSAKAESSPCHCQYRQHSKQQPILTYRGA